MAKLLRITDSVLARQKTFNHNPHGCLTIKENLSQHSALLILGT
jgi:hypothetical protein